MSIKIDDFRDLREVFHLLGEDRKLFTGVFVFPPHRESFIYKVLMEQFSLVIDGCISECICNPSIKQPPNNSRKWWAMLIQLTFIITLEIIVFGLASLYYPLANSDWKCVFK